MQLIYVYVCMCIYLIYIIQYFLKNSVEQLSIFNLPSTQTSVEKVELKFLKNDLAYLNTKDITVLLRMDLNVKIMKNTFL